ncbi:MAG: WD40 repeat domain-containing protein [Anaerolineae bacterium]|nr:WD40 repeat domain-containing protein [Anaerolineae bacterium]
MFARFVLAMLCLLLTACGSAAPINPTRGALPTLPNVGWRLLAESITAANAEKLALIGNLVGHKTTVNRFAFDPLRNWLISVDAVGVAMLWDLNSGRRIQVLSQPEASDAEGDVLHAFFSAKSDTIALVTRRGVRFLRTADRAPLPDLAGGAIAITDAARSADGQQLATTGGTGEVWLWDAVSGRVVRRIAGNGYLAEQPLFAPDNAQLAVISRDARSALVRVYSVRSGEVLAELRGFGSTPTVLAFNPDGTLLAVGARGEVQVFRTSDYAQVYSIAAPELEPRRGLAFSPDRRLLTIGGQGDDVFVQAANNGADVGRLVGHGGTLSDLAFSADGELLLTVMSSERGVYVWLVKSIQPQPSNYLRGTLGKGQNGFLTGAFSPDGKLIALAEASGGIMVYGIPRQ